MRKLIVTLFVAGLLGGLAALGVSVASSDAATAHAAGTKTITVGDDFFKPHKFSIAKNTIVKWVWASGNVDDHQVQEADKHFDAKSKGFHSKDQVTGDPFRHRYKKAGTFYVICNIHPDQMRMKIVVKP